MPSFSCCVKFNFKFSHSCAWCSGAPNSCCFSASRNICISNTTPPPLLPHSSNSKWKKATDIVIVKKNAAVPVPPVPVWDMLHQRGADAEPVLPWCLLKASQYFDRFANDLYMALLAQVALISMWDESCSKELCHWLWAQQLCGTLCWWKYINRFMIGHLYCDFGTVVRYYRWI